MLDADVEGQIAGGQQAQPLQEGRLQAEALVGLGLDQSPDAAHRPILGQPVEIGLDRGTLLQRRVDDHPGEAGVAIGQSLDPRRLGKVQARIDGDLGEDQLVDLDRRSTAIEVGQIVTTVDLGHTAEPAIAQPGRVVEVDVAVDDRKARHRSAPDPP